MRIIIAHLLVLFLSLSTNHLFAQDNEIIQFKINELEKKKTDVIAAERESLKLEVEHDLIKTGCC